MALVQNIEASIGKNNFFICILSCYITDCVWNHGFNFGKNIFGQDLCCLNILQPRKIPLIKKNFFVGDFIFIINIHQIFSSPIGHDCNIESGKC